MATLALDFPANLTTKYQPRSLSEFCGLEKQCKMLSKLAQNPPKDGAALLFEGGPGTGKTSAAFCFANSIIGRAEIHHIGSQESTIDNWKAVTAMCQYIPLNAKFHVIIVR
jgi:DNA polymerase III delta prime subunit